MNPSALTPQGAFAAALLDPERQLPTGLSTWNGSEPTKRFAVYRNNVTASLISALAAKFPIIRELVGAEFFSAMATLYLRQNPPRARRLAEFGDDFAAFIGSFEPAKSLPYLADMARLEALRLDAYHAADETTLEPVVFAQLPAGNLAALRFRFVPWVAVLRSDFAVFSLFAAHRGDVALADVDPMQGESVLISRKGDCVTVTQLEAPFALFLHMLILDASLGEAATSILSSYPDFDLSVAMAGLISGQHIAEILTPQGTSL